MTRRADEKVKRMLDGLASAVGLLVLAPVGGLIAALIRLDSPGPVFFLQERVGRNGTIFILFKFRTMEVGTPNLSTEEIVRQGIDRRTRVGRWLRRSSLDELPQLWNVLRGEMSLVGPRPSLPSQVSLNVQRRAAGVDALLPGITGWAQINGRDDLDDSTKVAHDQYYLANRSIGLDLHILVRTLLPVLSGRGNH
jgi:O-antigen biosynthesis protein WbqP